MFYIYILIMLVGYTMNNIAYVNLARKYDWVLLSLYRAISIWLILSPLLFFTNILNLTLNNLIISLLIGFVWGIWIIFQLEAYKYLPVWIVSSLMNLNVIFVIIFWFLFYNEKLDLYWYIWWTLVLWSSIILWFFKNDFSHLNKKYKKGIFLIGLRIITLSLWVFWIAYLWREVDIYTSVYLWETTCIITLAFILLYEKHINNKRIKYFSKNDTFKVFKASILPSIWTFALVNAFAIGNIWIVSITMASISIFTAFIAHYIFSEKLLKIQWLLIIITMIWLVVMNLWSL